MTDHKDLIVWQKARLLVKEIYQLTQFLPKEEIFGLTNQIRRAAISIPSNIAEGYNRHSDKEFVHFLKIAKGSAGEVDTQLLLCTDLDYLTQENVAGPLHLNQEILRILGTMILNVERKCKNN